MSGNIPNKVTILTGYPHRELTIIIESWGGRLTVQDGLTYDEFLGSIARLYCPTMDDGTPNRMAGRPLFLEAPKKEEPKHPDAAGDKAPECANGQQPPWPKLTDIHIDSCGVACTAKPTADIHEASMDAIRMAFQRNQTVRMEFNSRTYRFSPSDLIDKSIDPLDAAPLVDGKCSVYRTICDNGHLIVTTKKYTEFHTQARVSRKNLSTLWIWDVYPTKKKCVRNRDYSNGQTLKIEGEWTTKAIHEAAVSMAETNIPF